MVGEPFNKRSVPCAFGIKIGLYFHGECSYSIWKAVGTLAFYTASSLGGAYVLPVHQELFNLSAQHTATSGFVYSISSTINFFKRLSTRFYNFSDFRRLHGYLEDTAITKIYVLSIFILYESDTIHSALKKSGNPVRVSGTYKWHSRRDLNARPSA